MIEFQLNEKSVQTDVDGETPLLWVVRDHFGLKGSKYGCGKGLCGACSMHLDGMSVRTCILPVSAVAGKNITTIEGLGQPNSLHILQQAWIDGSVSQCGYCQSGQLMSASALLNTNPTPNDADIDTAMSGNICRCGTYPRIRKAIKQAAEKLTAGETDQTGAGS
jgi:isoquinoline 1-oxidoreductase alpha subunit